MDYLPSFNYFLSYTLFTDIHFVRINKDNPVIALGVKELNKNSSGMGLYTMRDFMGSVIL